MAIQAAHCPKSRSPSACTIWSRVHENVKSSAFTPDSKMWREAGCAITTWLIFSFDEEIYSLPVTIYESIGTLEGPKQNTVKAI